MAKEKKKELLGGRQNFLFQYMTTGHVDLFSVVLVVDLIKPEVLPLKLWSGASSSPEKGKSSEALPHSLTTGPR